MENNHPPPLTSHKVYTFLDIKGLHSTWRRATGWTDGNRIPVGARFSATFQTDPEAHSLLYDGYRVSFLGVKRPGGGVNHPLTSSAKVKGSVELYLYSPCGPSWPVLGRTLLFTFTFIVTVYVRLPAVTAAGGKSRRLSECI